MILARIPSAASSHARSIAIYERVSSGRSIIERSTLWHSLLSGTLASYISSYHILYALIVYARLLYTCTTCMIILPT
jgi:hypothetical protein